MKNRLLLSVLSLGLSLGAHAAEFSISSHDISDGHPLSPREVFQGFGCEGGNTSPELSWKNAPPGTKSFAITVYDPDAPTGSSIMKAVSTPASSAPGKPMPCNGYRFSSVLCAECARARNAWSGTTARCAWAAST